MCIFKPYYLDNIFSCNAIYFRPGAGTLLNTCRKSVHCDELNLIPLRPGRMVKHTNHYTNSASPKRSLSVHGFHAILPISHKEPVHGQHCFLYICILSHNFYVDFPCFPTSPHSIPCHGQVFQHMLNDVNVSDRK